MSTSNVHNTYPIAIVGVACRLPGAPDVDAFWDVLTSARDTVTELPHSRRALIPESSVEHGGFLAQIDGFDAPFFEMSPHEAVRVDPHHRLLMEVVWEALEDAGLSMESLAGSASGVYTSCFGSQYWNLLRDAGVTDIHTVLGAHRWAVPAGRIAHFLDLRGPTMGIESTCASSLVAVHVAAQAIRSGEIGMAIVGAANLLLPDRGRLGLAEAGLISPTFRCRFGDAEADGYVPAEGAVAVILKPLAAAIEDGDQVYATIIGSSVTSNGRQAASAGATGTTGQETLLRTAFRDAGVAAADLDYIEAHGPGTPLGDQVELTALDRVLREERPGDHRCLVGSVKSNIGHAEAAAGLAGLVKTALALRHRTVPATLHVRRRHPILRADDTALELAHVTQPMPERGRPAIAGVTALGMFGIGAHVVLTEAPAPASKRDVATPDQALLLPLSTQDPQALPVLAAAYADRLANSARPSDICFSAGSRRSHLPHRIAFAGADRDALIGQLRRFADENSPASPDDERTAGPPRVVFVFSGQGSQWVGMARQLLATEPVFARRLRECDEAIGEERGWSLVERLLGDRPMRIEHEVQPTLWAMQVSLAALLRHWGIQPDLVIGGSLGEIAAATTAGALTLRDGATVVCRRSALVGTLEPGAMVAVRLGEHEARQAIGDLADQVHVAVVNSVRSTVLAGDPEALAVVVDKIRRRGVFFRRIEAAYASHSPHVEPLRDELVAALAGLSPRPATVAMHSTALNRSIRGEELDAAYWMANLRQPVHLAAAVRAALTGPQRTLFFEVSPHPLLVPAIEDGIEASGANAAAVPCLLRDRPERESLLAALGTAYRHGCVPDWAKLYDHGRFVALPSYPWRRRRFWLNARQKVATTAAKTEAPARPVGPVAVPQQVSRPATPLPAIRPTGEALTRLLVRRVAEVLAASPDSIDPTVPLRFAGLDSLLATKLVKRLRDELDVHVRIDDLLGDHSLTDVAKQLADSTAPRKPSAPSKARTAKTSVA